MRYCVKYTGACCDFPRSKDVNFVTPHAGRSFSAAHKQTVRALVCVVGRLKLELKVFLSVTTFLPNASFDLTCVCFDTIYGDL